MRILRIGVFALLAVGALPLRASADAITIIDTGASLGAYWTNFLDGFPNGFYLLTNKFVFTGTTGTTMKTVGAYLQNDGLGAGTPFEFQVFADSVGAPGAPGVLLGQTSFLQPANTSLKLVTAALLSPINLINGQSYWIGLSSVGSSTLGSYTLGGTTPRGGTFLAATGPDGSGLINIADFGDDNELAIFASGEVPEPATLTLLGTALAGMASRSWRQRQRSRRLSQGPVA